MRRFHRTSFYYVESTHVAALRTHYNPRSSTVSEAVSPLDVYYNTSQNVTYMYYYSKVSIIWLVLLYCFIYNLAGFHDMSFNIGFDITSPTLTPYA